MNIMVSIFGLAKNDNGIFKSEKQAAYLISQIEKMGGCIGHVNSGYNNCPIFVEYDIKGITKIIKGSKNGDVVMFERKHIGELTINDEKLIKYYERKLKRIEKEIEENKALFFSGMYDNSGDKLNYEQFTVELYVYKQNNRKDTISEIKRILSEIKGL